MRALQVEAFGDPSGLKVTQVEERSPNPGEVKLKVSGTGVGYFDGLLIKGEYQIKQPLPFVPGTSVAGVVEEVGDGVTGLKPGDPVAAFALLGGLAEKVVVGESFCVKLPASVPMEIAASFLITYATGVLGLKNLAKLKPNETVLILGASGTTGSAAPEISKAMGAKVIACASTASKRQSCLEKGADCVVDYTQEDWRKEVKTITAKKGVDVVFDPVGGDFSEPALRSMAPGGRYLVVGFVSGIACTPMNLPLLKRCSVIGVNWGGEVFANPGIVKPVIEQLIEWVLEKKLKSGPDAMYSLEESSKAFESLLNRQSVGKVVITPG